MWKRGNGWKINPARVSTRRSEDHWSRGSGQGDWNTVWEFVVRLRNKNRSGIRSFLAFSHTNCRMISRNQNEKRDSSKGLRMYNAELLYYRLFYTKIRHIYILRISVNFIREINLEKWEEKKKEANWNENRNIRFQLLRRQTEKRIFPQYASVFHQFLFNYSQIPNLF